MHPVDSRVDSFTLYDPLEISPKSNRVVSSSVPMLVYDDLASVFRKIW